MRSAGTHHGHPSRRGTAVISGFALFASAAGFALSAVATSASTHTVAAPWPPPWATRLVGPGARLDAPWPPPWISHEVRTAKATARPLR